jgi:hypothetical protein
MKDNLHTSVEGHCSTPIGMIMNPMTMEVEKIVLRSIPLMLANGMMMDVIQFSHQFAKKLS